MVLVPIKHTCRKGGSSMYSSCMRAHRPLLPPPPPLTPHRRARTRKFTRTHKKVHTHAQESSHARTRKFTRTHKKVHMHAQESSHARTRKFTRTHKKVHTHAHTRTHTYTQLYAAAAAAATTTANKHSDTLRLVLTGVLWVMTVGNSRVWIHVAITSMPTE